METQPSTEELYAALLADARPSVIETPEEHERLLTLAERLMEKGENLSPEEIKLLALIVFLIEAFEASVDPDEDEEESAEPPQPCETLQRLLQARQLDLNDVEHVFGNGHLAREVLAGKRPISRGQAKELARFFQVPAKLFH